MKCWWLVLTIFSIPGHAQQFAAADLKLLKLYSTGNFLNEAQAKADAHFLKSALTVRPIWQKRKDGIWLFTEKKDTVARYQVWHFYLQDDTTLVMQSLDFKDIGKARQLSQDMKQESKLYLYNLFTRHGCELYLKKDKKDYSGSSSGKECFTNRAGSEYFAYTITLTKNSIAWNEVEYDKEDKPVLGSDGGIYNFVRQVKSSK